MVYATPPIACNVSNVQAVAVRVYHYLAGQVKAGIRGQIFSMNIGIIRSLCRGKVVAYPFQRLAVCQTYLTALFTCQRTTKEEIFLSAPTLDCRVFFANQFPEFFIFLSHHIGNEKCHLLS